MIGSWLCNVKVDGSIPIGCVSLREQLTWPRTHGRTCTPFVPKKEKRKESRFAKTIQYRDKRICTLLYILYGQSVCTCTVDLATVASVTKLWCSPCFVCTWTVKLAVSDVLTCFRSFRRCTETWVFSCMNDFLVDELQRSLIQSDVSGFQNEYLATKLAKFFFRNWVYRVLGFRDFRYD